MNGQLRHSLICSIAVLLGSCAADSDIDYTEQIACIATVDGSWSETADGTWDERSVRSFDSEGQLVRNDTYLMSELPDASEDGYLYQYTNYVYDLTGRRVLRERWISGRAAPYECEAYEYDDESRVVFVDHTCGELGTAIVTTAYTYGEFGVSSKVETNESGMTRTEYSYNEDGLWSGTEVFVDGARTTTIARTYDDAERLTSVLQNHIGEDAETRLDTLEYDERGNHISTLTDFGLDGVINSIRTYEYDEQGQQIVDELDADADGVVDRSDFSRYDDHGRVVFESQQARSGSGAVDISNTYDFSCHDAP